MERECQCFFCQGFPQNFSVEEVHAAAREMIRERDESNDPEVSDGAS